MIKQLQYINLDSQLVDPDKDGPMCADTPSFSTEVYVKGTKKEIYRSSGCHEWRTDNYTANMFATWANVFFGY